MELQNNSVRENRIPTGQKNFDAEVIATNPDLLFVEPELQKQIKSPTGVIKPNPKYQGVPVSGKVLLIGENIKKYKVGDWVIFRDPNGWGFHAQGVAYIPLEEKQVICRLKKAKK